MSRKNGEIYIGSTIDLKARLQIHNLGGEISTKRYLPWELVYYEAYTTESLARMRESRLKQHGSAKRELKRRIGFFDGDMRGGLPSTTFAEPFKSGAKRGLPSTTFAEPFKSGAGFTVVELLVATSVFVIFLGIVFGVFVQSVKGQRGLTKFFAVQNNAALVLEQMAREMRTGYWFCDGAHPSGASVATTPCEERDVNFPPDSLAFRNYNGQDIEYCLDGVVIKRGMKGSCASGSPLTSSAVQVSKLAFFVTQESDKCVPARVTVAMEVKLAGTTNVPPVRLQTTVSSRVLPVDVRNAPEDVRASCQF